MLKRRTVFKLSFVLYKIVTNTYLIPVYNTEFEIQTKKKISKVYIAPDMTDIEFTQQNDSVKFTPPYFENHAMIVME